MCDVQSVSEQEHENEINKLEQQVAEAIKSMEEMANTIDVSDMQIRELKASNKRLKDGIAILGGYVNPPIQNGGSQQEIFDIYDLCNESPQTSLAEHNANLIEEMSDKLEEFDGGGNRFSQFLYECANTLRQEGES